MQKHYATLFASFLLFLADATMAQSAKAPLAPPANATPFGLEIGVATCDAVRAKFNRPSEKKLEGGDVWLEASNREQLYPGANSLGARCSGNKLIAVQIEASKGGMENEGSREVFATLKSKYKLVSGGPMPSLGDGYARFAVGNTVIEQSAPHLSFVFSVTYFEKSFYDGIVAAKQKEQQQAKSKKQSSL